MSFAIVSLLVDETLIYICICVSGSQEDSWGVYLEIS